MFEGFEHQQITTSGTTINFVKGGNGPARPFSFRIGVAHQA